MIFSRIGRSLSRSSRAKEYLRGDAKLGTLLGATRTNVHSQGTELGLRFFRGYVAHARARGNGILSSLPDFKCVPANPKIHYRLFFSERSKKNSKLGLLLCHLCTVYCGKLIIANCKSQRQTEMIMEMFTLFPLSNFFISSLVMALITVACFYRPEGQQINFQEFKYELLEPRLVDHIVVSINKSIARIYVRNTPRNQTDSEVVEGTLPAKGTGGQYKFYFNIGSVKSFEENLKAAQEELGLEPHDYVPVTYSFEVDWEQELMSTVAEEKDMKIVMKLEGDPAVVSSDCSSSDLSSSWKFISHSGLHLQDNNTGLCLDKDRNSSILVTNKCICVGDDTGCLDNPQSQCFQLVTTNVE
ncbi:hypothetical protein AHAS_Ahas14G0223400 [Arachis hypogaea]